jgi:hypothetical protein
LPSRNEADADEIPADVRNELQIIFVSRIREVLDSALEVLVANPPPPIVSDSIRGGLANEPEPLTVKGK